MKAYIITDSQNQCENTDVIWAKTAKEAKNKAFGSELMDDVEFINLRANRCQ